MEIQPVNSMISSVRRTLRWKMGALNCYLSIEMIIVIYQEILALVSRSAGINQSKRQYYIFSHESKT